MRVVAWTGGSSPAPLKQISSEERALVRRLLNEQIKLWRDYWGDFPDNQVLQTFFNRARYDAHATFRH